MPNERTARATNFTCFHAGPMEGWAQFRPGPPDVPVPTRGKLFLRNLLGSAGLEMSLNVVPPGKGIPFLHRHQQNDEVWGSPTLRCVASRMEEKRQPRT
jgi:hypothetical protein